MENYVFLVFTLSMCLGVCKNLISKYAKIEFSGLRHTMDASIVTSLVAIVISLFQGIDSSVFLDLRFMIMSLLYGICTMSAQTFYIKASKDGPVSVCSLLYAFCFLLPTIFMALYFGETLSIIWVIGIIMTLLSAFLVVYRKDNTKSSSKSYIPYIIVAMISAGCVGLLQKFYAFYYNNSHFTEYIFMSFVFMLILAFIMRIFSKRESCKEGFNQKRFVISMLILGISNVVASKLNLFLSGVMPAKFFFPAINGGTIMLSALMSVVLFKEKLTIKGILGIMIGVSAIVLMGI